MSLIGSTTSAPVSNFQVGNTPAGSKSVAELLFDSGAEFDFFQAVSLLEAISPDLDSVQTSGGPSHRPAVRFGADAGSASFAASSIREVQREVGGMPPKIVVGFMGLTGPSGVLPEHYTELVRSVEYEGRGDNKYALREWLDLFNNRLIGLFYLSWKKYRPYASFRDSFSPSTRGRSKDDKFCSVLHSICGLGTSSLTKPLKVFTVGNERTALPNGTAQCEARPAKSQAKTDTARMALIRYAGLLAQRPRSAENLEAVLEDYFGYHFEVQQFAGNWLQIDREAQSQLGVLGGNSTLGVDAVAGDQVWERQNRIVIRVGPLNDAEFTRLLPDQSPEFSAEKNDFQLLCDLIRLFIGAEFDFDIQLIMRGAEIREPSLTSDKASGLRLGWNAWLHSEERPELASDSILYLENDQ